MGPLFWSCFLVVIGLSMTTADTTGNGLGSGGRVIKVGGQLGWHKPGLNNSDLYSLWASRNRFQVGDFLSFEYNNDSVIQVDKWGYYHCSARQPIVAFDNGKSLFKLDRPGPFYYISGTLNHCKMGQRLLVEVMGFHHHDTHQYGPPPAHTIIASPPEYSYLAPSPQAHPTSSASVLGSVDLVGLVSVLVSAAFWFFCY